MHWNDHLCLWGQSISYIMIFTWGSQCSLRALMIELFCSILQLTMSRSEQRLSTFPLTSNVTNTQMCGLLPSRLPSRFCTAVCLHYGWKQHSLQSGWAGTEGSLVPRELVLQVWTGPWKMGSLTQASITLWQSLLAPEGQSCCLQRILVFQTFFSDVLVPGHWVPWRWQPRLFTYSISCPPEPYEAGEECDPILIAR